MPLVAGSEIAAGQAKHAALNRKSLGDSGGGSVERVTQEGEIGADSIQFPAVQVCDSGPETFRPSDDLAPVLLPPSGHRLKGRRQRMLTGAWRADLNAVHDFGEFRQKPL